MNYKIKLKKINTFIFDIDGVLTNGMVTLFNNGDQVRHMNTRDGYAIQYAIKNKYLVAIISGGNNDGVLKRLKFLGIKDIYLGCKEKNNAFEDLIKKYKLNQDNILYMGDDLPDLEVMKKVGVASCPNDAATEIKDISDYISIFKGGNGCVRDVIEQTLRVQDKWAKNKNLGW